MSPDIIPRSNDIRIICGKCSQVLVIISVSGPFLIYDGSNFTMVQKRTHTTILFLAFSREFNKLHELFNILS
jgi:hypothetical protein